ncbi:hypothetical protein [Paenibacillus polymyxa]|uniref:hypothetical protein n=1 Tax=Paenibacillus polymyxa TaxID=1406 RepID=UPI00040321D7|nr:hypothetical protein [Paenibacillus polymyxa]
MNKEKKEAAYIKVKNHYTKVIKEMNKVSKLGLKKYLSIKSNNLKVQQIVKDLKEVETAIYSTDNFDEKWHELLDKFNKANKDFFETLKLQ